MKLTTRPHLMLGLRSSAAVPLFPIYAYIMQTGVYMFTPGQEGYCTVLEMERATHKKLQVAYMTTETCPTGATCNKLCKCEFSRPKFTVTSVETYIPPSTGAIRLSLTLYNNPDNIFANRKQTNL